MKSRFLKGAKHHQIKTDKNGNVLCRWCKGVVSPPRKTYCSKECVHEWKLRSSGSYLRKCIFKRDKGICAGCSLDTTKITKGFRRPLKNESKAQWIKRVALVRKQYNIPKHRVTFWDANHILAVAEKGGQSGLLNFETLCLRCHQLHTKDLMKRLLIKKLKKKT